MVASDGEKSKEEKMLEAEAYSYHNCLNVNKERLLELLDFDLKKKNERLERVKARKNESMQAFDKFQNQQKDMFDRFIKSQENARN